MFEALESRQLFSVALTDTAPTAEPTVTATVEADAGTTAARKAGGKQQDYVVVTIKEVFVSGYGM